MRVSPYFVVAFFYVLLTTVVHPAQAQEKYIAGTHYQYIEIPVKTRDPNKIEVTEVFWYGCSFCNQFHPMFDRWKKQQADDININYLPVNWRKPMDIHASVFYTAKAFSKLEEIHKEIFNAIHIANQKFTSALDFFPLFKKHGISQEDFDKTFNSFGIRSQVRQANFRAKSYGVTGTPEVIVNGKYRISPRMVGAQAEILEVASFLIAKERIAKK